MPETNAGRLRLALVADGPPEDRHTNSGVAFGLLQALREHPGVETVIPVDASFRRVRKALVALHAVQLSEVRWRVKYSQGRIAVRMRSHLVRSQVRRLRGDVDLVILVRGLYEPFPFPYAMFVDSTVSLVQAGWPALAPHHGKHPSVVPADQAQLRCAEHVFTAARYVAEHLVRDYGLPQRRVTAIGGGLNYPLSAVPMRSPAARPTILFVGHDFHRKGGDVLVEAFHRVRAAVPEAHLLLVGRGTAAQPSRPGVTSLGEVDDRQQLSRLYQRATAFCLPARFEPYGLVFLEAMAHGVPCVGTRVGAIPEILQDGGLGMLVDAEDVAGLADALTTLLLDRDRQEDLSVRGRREVETNGTWADVADRLVDALTGTH